MQRLAKVRTRGLRRNLRPEIHTVDYGVFILDGFSSNSTLFGPFSGANLVTLHPDSGCCGTSVVHRVVGFSAEVLMQRLAKVRAPCYSGCRL